MAPACQKLTQMTPLESDQTRRGPTPGLGGSTTVTAPVAVSILAM